MQDDGHGTLLHIRLDTGSGIPVFRQIMDQIRYYVASGTLREGDQLPSIRRLARALSVNPTTVVRAYTELEHEGVLDRRHGRGVFVARAPAPLDEAAQRRALLRLVRQLVSEARQMGAADELVLDLVRQQQASPELETIP